MSVLGASFTEKDTGTLSEVFLVINLDFDRGVDDVRTFFVQFRSMNRVKLSLFFLLEITFHLQSTVVLLGCTESISFRQESRSTRPGVVIQESVSMNGLGSKSGGVNELY